MQRKFLSTGEKQLNGLCICNKVANVCFPLPQSTWVLGKEEKEVLLFSTLFFFFSFSPPPLPTPQAHLYWMWEQGICDFLTGPIH